MKLKSYIFQIALTAVGAGFLGSCEDMLEPTSEYVKYYDGSFLSNPADTATSLIGIIYKLQAIGDRTNLLGEVRGDLVTLNDRANGDLRALANFEDGDTNRYNNPRDYYAVINNCNYFLKYADTAAYDNRGNQIFAKEMAQVRAIRAWTYLQLALNYGKVPFYTDPLLTEQDADTVSVNINDRKGIEGICDFFINDLKPYSNTPWPALHTVGSIFMANCFFPVDMVLGDLYLWKASCQGRGDNAKTYYREAAKCYFRWIMDERRLEDEESKGVFNVFNDNKSVWNENTPSVGANMGIRMLTWSTNTGSYGGNSGNIRECFTYIPMDSAASQGYYSEVRGLYNTTLGEGGSVSTTTNFSITPSVRMQEISKAQSYSFVDENTNLPIEYVPKQMEDLAFSEGDLRLFSQFSSTTSSMSLGGRPEKFTTQFINKLNDRNIVVYRKTEVWLRLAEALNNGGFPRMAYAILATGIDNDVVSDNVSVYCNDDDLKFLSELNTPNNNFNRFKTRNGPVSEVGGTNVGSMTIGIHSRGSGYAELNPNYAYPMVDSLAEDGTHINGYTGQSRMEWAYKNMETEQARVDSMILNENALETCFEGKRFYDLIRFAKRYNDFAKWVAEPVSKRDGAATAISRDLSVESNCFLNWKGKIGMR